MKVIWLAYTPAVPLPTAAELLPALQAALVAAPSPPALSATQLERLATYLALVAEYDRAAQLTGLRSVSGLVDGLALESLRLLELGGLQRGAQLLDLGSGNGSPVVPLAIACPEVDCYASEVRARRVAFLQLCAVKLRLHNLHVLEGPVERLAPAGGGRWDILTSRAFAPPPRLLPLAAQLLGGPGELRGFLGAESTELQALAPQHGFTVAALEHYSLHGKHRAIYRLEHE